MSNANSLELVPPLQTAQPPARTDRTTKSDSADSSDSTDSKFKTKLAKKLHALQKPGAATTDKPAKPASDPAADGSTEDQTADGSVTTDAKVPADQAKAKTAVTVKGKPVPASSEDGEDSTAKATKPAKPATAVLDPAGQPVVKKSTDHKPAATAGKTPVVDPNAAAKLASAPNGPQTAGQAATQSDGDSDPDSVDGITPTTANVFGSGKVVAKTAATGSAAAAAATNVETDSTDAQAAAAATDDPAEIATPAAQIDEPAVKAAAPTDETDGTNSFASALDAAGKGTTGSVPLKSAAAAEPTPQARFVEANQPKIVSSIQGQLLPHGGTMQIRLDPPELGPMQVSVHMKDGVMTASFETTSEHATKLLSHTLSQLKSGLEAAGMNVEKLQVQQSPKKDGQSSSNGDSGNAPQEQQQQAHQEKQRREMVQRMWQKLAGGDPLDLVA